MAFRNSTVLLIFPSDNHSLSVKISFSEFPAQNLASPSLIAEKHKDKAQRGLAKVDINGQHSVLQSGH